MQATYYRRGAGAVQSYDVIIIGGGVVGSAIARELTRYQLSIAVLEKGSDAHKPAGAIPACFMPGFFIRPAA